MDNLDDLIQDLQVLQALRSMQAEIQYLQSMLALAVFHSGGSVLIPQSAIDEEKNNPTPVAFFRTVTAEGVKFECRFPTPEDYAKAGVPTPKDIKNDLH